MALFKKRNPGSAQSDQAEQAAAPAVAANDGMRIKILGTGCVNCHALDRAVQETMQRLGLDLPVGHVSELAEIAAYGIMSIPALVLDGKVVCVGRVPRMDELEALLAPLKEA